MQEKDTYKTLKTHSDGLYKDKGSKFIALACPISSEEEARERLAEAKNTYHDARHHCYAWVLGYQQENWRINDDGEPSGTAGKPIHGQILSAGLTNTLIIVVRYFGGTKLGVRGLINAYKGAAREAIGNNRILQKTIRKYYRLSFGYPSMNDVMRILKEHNLPQHGHDFQLTCTLDFSVRLNEAHNMEVQFGKLRDVAIEFLYTV
ncbi:MAG: IMPACT family protein [Bacteroidales bacterium]